MTVNKEEKLWHFRIDAPFRQVSNLSKWNVYRFVASGRLFIIMTEIRNYNNKLNYDSLGDNITLLFSNSNGMSIPL